MTRCFFERATVSYFGLNEKGGDASEKKTTLRQPITTVGGNWGMPWRKLVGRGWGKNVQKGKLGWKEGLRKNEEDMVLARVGEQKGEPFVTFRAVI
jgi:hypothetical protein